MNKVFDQHWFNKHQKKILWLANSWLGKFIFKFEKMGTYHKLDRSKPFSQITPNAATQYLGPRLVRTKGKQKRGIVRHAYRTQFFSRNEYARKLYFALLPMWWAMHIWDFFAADYFQLAPNLNFGFSSLTVNPGSIGASNPIDGKVWKGGAVDKTWATIIAATGDNNSAAPSSENYIGWQASSTANRWFELYRAITCYDTSSLTASAIISAAVLSLFLTSKQDPVSNSPNIDIYTSTPAATNALASGDYNQLGSTSQTGAAISYSSVTTSAYNDFTFNSTGRGNISLTSISKFGVRNANFDVAATAPSTSGNNQTRINGNYSGNASNKPQLVVTYTLPTAPTVTTSAADTIAWTSANGNGNVTSDGGATVTERGFCWSTSSNPTTSNSKVTAAGTTGAYSAAMTGLQSNTLYHFRAYAINSVGTSYGADTTFTTLSNSGMFGVF